MSLFVAKRYFHGKKLRHNVPWHVKLTVLLLFNARIIILYLYFLSLAELLRPQRRTLKITEIRRARRNVEIVPKSGREKKKQKVGHLLKFIILVSKSKSKLSRQQMLILWRNHCSLQLKYEKALLDLLRIRFVHAGGLITVKYIIQTVRILMQFPLTGNSE